MATELKALVCKTIDDRSSDLNKISQEIWNNPELCYNEHFAHELLTTFLEKEGFEVNKKTPLETSFIARYGCGSGLKIGVICEYDALPGIGHACGHNLIAEAGITAALGIKAVLMNRPDLKVQLIVFGTPAEEGGGGKVKMVEKGVFDEVDICMMSHPTPFEIGSPVWLAASKTKILFKGKASHASAAPWEGINALDAAVACYTSVSMMRQQLKPTTRICGVFTDGGDKPNIIPQRAELEFIVRALTDSDMVDLKDKLVNCAKGAAQATGCSVEFSQASPGYSALKTNKILIDFYVNNAKSLGVTFNDADSSMVASTDMGNVSQIKPSIHPLYRINTAGANHTHEFTKATGSAESQLPTLNSGKSMAMTAIDVVFTPNIMKEVLNDFKN